MKVKICGIEHEITEKDDCFGSALHLGTIDYATCKISLNSEMTSDLKQATLCHEILHGLLVHIGRGDLNDDEQFVTALGTALSGSFTPKTYD